MHNAQVCYFNNVWLMFLIFLKNFSFQTIVGPPLPRRFFIFFQLLPNIGFHRITLGQSDSAPTGAPSIHWMPKHRFPSDHTGPKWFSTHQRTIHPLDAWTCCGWTWTFPLPSPPVLVHRHWLTDQPSELIYMIYCSFIIHSYFFDLFNLQPLCKVDLYHHIFFLQSKSFYFHGQGLSISTVKRA
jgi:hypothetical protein